MESPAAVAEEPPWYEERFLVITARVAAAANATDALVINSRRLSVELFSTLSAMIASCTRRRNSRPELLKLLLTNPKRDCTLREVYFKVPYGACWRE